MASASPRRHDLLKQAGLRFKVEAAGVDEGLAGARAPQAAARELALRKSGAVAGLFGQGTWVIGADTVVALSLGPDRWRLLGKPASSQEARGMLQHLSNSRHVVVTGVAVVDCATGKTEVDHGATWVTMRTIEKSEIEAYVDSGEWRDKAGGYAIQENADAFVIGLEGAGFDNVVGLPVALTLELLGRLGAPDLPSPPTSAQG